MSPVPFGSESGSAESGFVRARTVSQSAAARGLYDETAAVELDAVHVVNRVFGILRIVVFLDINMQTVVSFS